MKKINFAEIIAKGIDGKDKKYDVHYSLSDALYMGKNVAESALGLKIYNTRDEKGKPAEVELNDEEVAIIKSYVEGFPYIIRQAILEKLKD